MATVGWTERWVKVQIIWVPNDFIKFIEINFSVGCMYVLAVMLSIPRSTNSKNIDEMIIIRTEDHATVFLKWMDFTGYARLTVTMEVYISIETSSSMLYLMDLSPNIADFFDRLLPY